MMGNNPEGFAMKDSGKREDFGTGAVRDSREGKGRYDLISPIALKRLAVVYEKGANKYHRDVVCSAEAALSLIVKEVSKCKNVQYVEAKFIPTVCVEAAMRKTLEKEIRSSQKGKELTAESGAKTTPTKLKTKIDFELKTPTAELGISEQGTLPASEKSDSLKKVVSYYLSDRQIPAQCAEEILQKSGQYTLTMTMTRGTQEDIYVVGATTELECLKSLLKLCRKLFPISRILRLESSSCGNILVGLTGERNWEEGMSVCRCLDSAKRHMDQWLMGDIDEDHLGHAMWNIAAIIHMQEVHPELDDRPNWQVGN